MLKRWLKTIIKFKDSKTVAWRTPSNSSLSHCKPDIWTHSNLKCRTIRRRHKAVATLKHTPDKSKWCIKIIIFRSRSILSIISTHLKKGKFLSRIRGWTILKTQIFLTPKISQMYIQPPTCKAPMRRSTNQITRNSLFNKCKESSLCLVPLSSQWLHNRIRRHLWTIT